MSPRSCLLSALLVCVAAASDLDQHQLELKEHFEHLTYIAGFPCHVPQPRVVAVKEVFPPSETLGKAYFPDVTVLHRCDEAAGCCTQARHCGPLHVETITLPFKITFLEDIEKHKKGDWLIEYHYLKNHTECDCLEKPYSPDYPDNSVPSSSEFSPSFTLPSTYSANAGYSSTRSPDDNGDIPWKASGLGDNEPLTSSTSRLDGLKDTLSFSPSSSSSSQELSVEDIEQLLHSAYKPENSLPLTVGDIKNEKTSFAQSPDEVCEEDPK